MTKFGKQLLAAWIFSISVVVFSNLAFGAPVWAEKPIQCASPSEVFEVLADWPHEKNSTGIKSKNHFIDNLFYF